uniref:DUF4211 domain-containing protein n=1 Tax=Timema cristinae TaxID=61476 RepID=A0A7R9C9J9_TIMCR|nr:unnamed protein product [Timema cristinae]
MLHKTSRDTAHPSAGTTLFSMSRPSKALCRRFSCIKAYVCKDWQAWVMDPVGPWSAYAASYNRLAGSAGFQAAGGAGGAGEFVSPHHPLTTGNSGLGSHQGAGVPSTTSQLLLQAAHSSGQLGPGTTPSPFNPGGFLSPPPVSYDAVFSPLFHHASPKPAHYGSSLNRQALAQAQAQAVAAANKQASVESELSSLRENYSSAHHQTLASGGSFFDHQASSSSPSATLAWSHQNNAQLPSPFGILPHETVVTSSPGPVTKASSYDTFNAHFAAAHLNSQLNAVAEYKNAASNYLEKKASRSQSPAKPISSSASNVSAGNSSGNFFHQSATGSVSFAPDTRGDCSSLSVGGNFPGNKSQQISSATDFANAGTKSFSGSSSTGSSVHHQQQQQSCIVSTASSTPTSKDYRIPQPPSRSSTTSIFLNAAQPTARGASSQSSEKQSRSAQQQQNFVPPTSKSSAATHHSIQTKAQSKIYPELGSSSERRATESSTYSTTSSGSQPQNGPTDCGVVVPRRPSPLQAHSQASPLGHVPSPAYPLYNSPMTSMSSPSPLQQHSDPGGQCPPNGGASGGPSRHSNPAPPSPLDVTVQRPSSQGSQQGVAYSSVITRALTTTDNRQGGEFSGQKQQGGCWPETGERVQAQATSHHVRKSYPVGYGSAGGATMDLPQQAVPQQQQRVALGISERQQAYFDSTPGHQVTLQDLSSCRGDPMSIVKNLQTLQQQSCQLQVVEPPKQVEESPRPPVTKSSGGSKRRKSSDKTHTAAAGLNTSEAMSEYFTNRVPPPAHLNTNQQAQQNGGYFDFERWNLPPPPPKMFGAGTPHGGTPIHHVTTQHQSLMVPHPHHHPPPPLPYFPAFPLHHPAHHPPDFPPQEAVSGGPMTYDSSQSPGNGSYPPQEPPQEDQPKVIVPNIEEELGFLSENSTVTTGTPAVSSLEVKKPLAPPITPANPSTGFMASYMKFLQGERDSSPPPQNRGGRKTTWARTKIYQPEPPRPPPDASTTTTATTTTITTTTNTNTTSSTTASTTSAIKATTEVTPKKTEPPPVRTYDPQDDPRYFPLPKNDASRRSFSDSDDSDSELLKEKEKQRLLKEKAAKDKEAEDARKAAIAQKNALKKAEALARKAESSASKKKDGLTKKDGTAKKDQSTKKTDQSLKKGDAGSKKLEVTGPKKLDSATAAAQVVSKVGLTLNKNSAGSRRRGGSKAPSKKKQEQEEAFADWIWPTRNPCFKASFLKYTIYGDKEVYVLILDPLLLPPRREVSRRKAKEKTTIKQFLDRQESMDEDVDEPELVDSDSDPAWTPAAKDSSDEDAPRRRASRRNRSLVVGITTRSKRPRRTEDGFSSTDDLETMPLNKRQSSANHRSRGRSQSLKAVGNPVQPATKEGSVTIDDTDADMLPFKSGEFVVMKSDLNEEYPPIWRIDGKTLLQKYEPFDQNGKTLYRNISTYSGWTPQNRHIYQQVPVKFRVQNRLETIVEFMRTEMPVEDQEMIEKSMKETAKYQDNFEVYIQTLISQALDSNFLTEIFQEQDDYFLSNVKCVDEITEERKGRLLRVAQWKPSLSNSVGTWPCFNFITDLPADEKTGKLCVACDKAPVAVRVQMYGQPYNSTTLEGCQPDPKVASQKDFLVCAVCAGRVKLYNKVAHQKYLMYIECAKRVADKRLSDPKKDTTVILNELLADEAWLNQLFKTVRTSWAQIDKLEHQAKQTVPSSNKT